MEHILLREIRDDYEKYETGVIEFFKLTEEDKDMILTFNIIDEINDTILSQWEIRCVNYVRNVNKFEINHNYLYEMDVDVYDNAILGWENGCDSYSIYYNKSPQNPESFIGALYIAHNETTKGFIPFGKFIYAGEKRNFNNYSFNIDNLKESPGIFACGPEPLMNSYYRVLTNYYMEPRMLKNNSIINEFFKNNEFMTLTFDKSYIMATHLKCVKKV